MLQVLKNLRIQQISPGPSDAPTPYFIAKTGNNVGLMSCIFLKNEVALTQLYSSHYISSLCLQNDHIVGVGGTEHSNLYIWKIPESNVFASTYPTKVFKINSYFRRNLLLFKEFQCEQGVAGLKGSPQILKNKFAEQIIFSQHSERENTASFLNQKKTQRVQYNTLKTQRRGPSITDNFRKQYSPSQRDDKFIQKAPLSGYLRKSQAMSPQHESELTERRIESYFCNQRRSQDMWYSPKEERGEQVERRIAFQQDMGNSEQEREEEQKSAYFSSPEVQKKEIKDVLEEEDCEKLNKIGTRLWKNPFENWHQKTLEKKAKTLALSVLQQRVLTPQIENQQSFFFKKLNVHTLEQRLQQEMQRKRKKQRGQLASLNSICSILEGKLKNTFYDIFHFSELVHAAHRHKLEYLEARLFNLAHLNEESLLTVGFKRIIEFGFSSQLRENSCFRFLHFMEKKMQKQKMRGYLRILRKAQLHFLFSSTEKISQNMRLRRLENALLEWKRSSLKMRKIQWGLNNLFKINRANFGKVKLRWLSLWKKKAQLKRNAILNRFGDHISDYSSRVHLSLKNEFFGSLEKHCKQHVQLELKRKMNHLRTTAYKFMSKIVVKIHQARIAEAFKLINNAEYRPKSPQKTECKKFIEQPTLWVSKSQKPFKSLKMTLYSKIKSKQQSRAKEIRTIRIEDEEKDETSDLLQNRNWIKSEPPHSLIRDTFDQTETDARYISPHSSYESPLRSGVNQLDSLSTKLRETISKHSPGSPGYRTLYSKHNLRTSSPTTLCQLEDETLHRTPQMKDKTVLPNKFQLYSKFNSHTLTPPFSEGGRHQTTRDMESLADPLELISSTRSKVNFELLPSQNSNLRESPQFTPVQVRKSEVSERKKSRRAYKHKLLLRALKINIGYYAREMMGDRVAILDQKEKMKNAFVGDLLLKWKHEQPTHTSRQKNLSVHSSKLGLHESEQSFGSPQTEIRRSREVTQSIQYKVLSESVKSRSPQKKAVPTSPTVWQSLQREGLSPSENTNTSNLSTPVSQSSSEYKAKLELNKRYLRERQQLLAKYERSKKKVRLGKRAEKRKGSFQETMKPLIKRK